jgi:hypothetical protein
MPVFSCCRRPRYTRYGPARPGGTVQEKCGTCGRLRSRRVRPCWLWHSYANAGRARYGVQPQACRRCGDEREVRARPCLLLHRWSGWGALALGRQASLQCTRCGLVKVVTA